jgi:hypothetical protein
MFAGFEEAEYFVAGVYGGYDSYDIDCQFL